MVIEAKPIVIAPGSELDELLRNAGGLPLLLERDGVRYRLDRDDAQVIWANYDPEAARQGIEDPSGGWHGVIDADAFKAYIRERPRPWTPPPVRRVNKRIRRGREAGLAKPPAMAPPELLALVPGAGSWRGVVDAEALKRALRASRRIKSRPSVRW